MQKVCYSILWVVLLAFFMQQFTGCCERTTLPPPGRPETVKKEPAQTPGETPESRTGAIERPLELLEGNGLNYSIDQPGRAQGNKKLSAGGSLFESKYMQGVELMEKGEYSEAISLFDELVKKYPNTEEASIAELCIAELYFRNKSNDMALKIYQRIVENYPQSHAAENARAGIDYLQSFDKLADEHVSSEIEDRKRRGY